MTVFLGEKQNHYGVYYFFDIQRSLIFSHRNDLLLQIKLPIVLDISFLQTI